MLLINSKQLELTALKDDSHPLHSYAKEYDAGIKHLKETYGDDIKFVRPGFPKRTKGIDVRGNEVSNMTELSNPMLVPLKARYQGKLGMEIWEYCQGMPKLLPNNLWEATGKRSVFVTDNITVSLKREPELAFFLYYKSPVFKSNLLKIDDPTAEAKAEGDKARAELDLQTALYGTLGDEEQLKIVAQAYGVAGVDKKHPDAIRKELKAIVLLGDKKKRTDPTVKGIKEFLEEMKVTDAVRLRSLVMTMTENKKIEWTGDGRYKIGEREICRVPQAELQTRQNFLCNHLLNHANRPKLQELLKDTVDKEYLDKVNDEKTFIWLAKVLELPHNFKKKDEIREAVYGALVVE
jgi:hypothetical protein